VPTWSSSRMTSVVVMRIDFWSPSPART